MSPPTRSTRGPIRGRRTDLLEETKDSEWWSISSPRSKKYSLTLPDAATAQHSVDRRGRVL